jgi:hypothetical protein
MKKFHFTIFKLPHCPHVFFVNVIITWVEHGWTTHVSCKCDYKLNEWWMSNSRWCPQMMAILSNNKPPHVQSTFCALLALPTRERERERLWNNAKFILGPHVEECSLGLSVNCEFIFWELGWNMVLDCEH